MGIGGLHSSEKGIAFKASDTFKLVDRDVASYYPSIILNQKLYPLHLGFDFLTVYQSLVSRRLAAKRSGNKIEADMLKITINGSFGKFGSKWSALYAPDLLIQVTLTGQLSLLMMIEALEMNGVQVCSSNTDGVVMRYPRIMEDTVGRVIKDWENRTNFETEETEYAALYCRDVNNYIAIKPGGKAKTKGAYNVPEGIFRFHKNPTNLICVEAAIEYLAKGTPVAQTVWQCRDLRKFLTVRKVNGGAVKDGVYLGKAIRWHYSTETGGEIIYAASGNKVPQSDGAKPCMDLPGSFPHDVDFARYEAEAVAILKEIAAI
jgi:DNA polymerase elongation subunit (family B)